jgi:hypothetical protein
MIINTKYKKDLITLDLRLNEIRYLKDIQNRGEILFYNYGNDLKLYEDILKESITDFKKRLKEDILNIFGLNLNIKEIEVLK